MPVEYGQETDVLILNSCTVTEGAEADCRRLVRQTLRKSPQRDCQDRSRHGAKYEHPAPFGIGRECEIDEIGDKNTGGDTELEQGNECPAASGRGGFGHIEWRHH